MLWCGGRETFSQAHVYTRDKLFSTLFSTAQVEKICCGDIVFIELERIMLDLSHSVAV